jgi:hypothetical protein
MIKWRTIRWTGHEAEIGEETNSYMELVGKAQGRNPLRRPGRRWVDNTKMDLERWVGLVRTGSIWLRIGTSGGLF